MSKVWTKDEVVNLLKHSDKAVERAILVLYHRQEQSEVVAQKTVVKNGRGFNAKDAPIFTSFAEGILKYRKLTEKQIALCRRPNSKGMPRIGKYWRQLLEAIQDKGGEVVVK